SPEEETPCRAWPVRLSRNPLADGWRGLARLDGPPSRTASVPSSACHSGRQRDGAGVWWTVRHGPAVVQHVHGSMVDSPMAPTSEGPQVCVQREIEGGLHDRDA